MLGVLLRDKVYTLINVAGLSLALVACVVLGLYLRQELTYDKHNVLADRIYRVANEFVVNGRSERMATTAGQLAPLLAKDMQGIDAYVRFRKLGSWDASAEQRVSYKDKALFWSDIYSTDENVFDVFTVHVLYGDPSTALHDPASAAVSKKFAASYFADANPLGEVIQLENGELKTITLVYDDLPDNSHLKYDVLLSYNAIVGPQTGAVDAEALFGASDFTYLLVSKTFNAREFRDKADYFFPRYMADRGRQIHVDGWGAWLQPLSDIHLYSDVTNDLPTGNLNYLLGLEAVVAFILVIACFNHINLATASAAKRAREIGVRKVLGINRVNLALRYVGESVLFSLLALLVCLVFLELAYPLTPLGNWLGKFSLAQSLHHPLVLASMLGFSLLIGILAGLYPAFYLSSVPVLHAMKHADRIGQSSLSLRNILVFIQFTITTCIICSVLIMESQMQFMKKKSLGFAEQGRVIVTLTGADVLEKLPVIASELLRNEHIKGVTSADAMLGLDLPVGFMDAETNAGEMSGLIVHHFPVELNFNSVAGIDVVQGRDFSPENTADPGTAMIVNEALVRQMGWENPLGKRMGTAKRKVIGVVRDFNYQSLHVPVGPLIMYKNTVNLDKLSPQIRINLKRHMLINIDTTSVESTLDYIGTVVRRFDAVHPFSYQFLSQALQTRYQDENHLMRLLGIFAALCIFISCLGLYGLNMFTIAQRTKEIGIRKVLGASIPQILMLVSRRTLALVLVASLFAWLIAYMTMNRWLSVFSYRIDMSVMVFMISTLIVGMLALSTVVAQSFKVVSSSPVLSLRSE